MTQWLPAILGVFICSCAFDPSGTAVDDIDEVAPSTQPEDDRTEDSEPPIPVPSLHSDGAIVRYFMNDSSFVDAPKVLTDAIDIAAGPSLDLDIVDPNELCVFVVNDTHGALAIEEIGEEARLSIATNGTKIAQTLNGSTKGMIELVVHVEETLSGSRLSHIGKGWDSGDFTLRARDDEELRFYLNGDEKASWLLDLTANERLILHLVLDTEQADEEDRAKLYVDGQALEPEDTSAIDLAEEIEITDDPDTHYVLGNRESGRRGIQATYYYAALYSQAMSAEEVAHNSDILRDNDDG